jgi:hypothetical protein
MSDLIINKVADSGLVEINLEEYYPKEEMLNLDLKEYLFMELIVKEKEFRESLKAKDWSAYKNKLVAVNCSADAIIPMWAYMLLASYLQPFAKDIFFGDLENLHKAAFIKNINKIDINDFREKRIVVKGCGDLPVGEFAYLEIAKLLRPVAKSIMYGEPCSTVPIYKQKSIS